MDKFFICLANSYKRGGRCIAGVEIDYKTLDEWSIVKRPDGIPRWIRPIAQTQYGEIPETLAIPLGYFTIIKLTDTVASPHNMHTEDTTYSNMVSVGNIKPTKEIVERLLDTVHDFPFGNQDRTLSADYRGCDNYSLMLIYVEKAMAFEEDDMGKSRVCMEFSHKGHSYTLPVTDPSFLEWFRYVGEKKIGLQNIYLTLSLGLEYEGMHHKLVASVITLNGMSASTRKMVGESGEYWSIEDDKLLDQKWRKGYSIQKLAREFGRDEDFIRMRLKTLSYQRYHGNLEGGDALCNDRKSAKKRMVFNEKLTKTSNEGEALCGFLTWLFRRGE